MTTQLEQFKLYLFREGNKPSSVLEKLKQLKRLKKVNPAFTKAGFDSFVLQLKEQGKINSYINNLIIVLRQWGKCFDIAELKNFPRIKGNNSTFIKGILADEEIEAFLSLPYWGAMNGLNKTRYDMWTIFFSILAYSGARPMEVARLTINDVDFGRNVFIFRYTKTGHPREVPISFVIKEKVEKFIKLLDRSLLFPNYYAKKIPHVDAFSWRYPFDERIKKLGIKRENLTVYSLRHSFITRQADEDVSIFKIQQIVGHRQLETTAKYVHLSTKALQDTIANDRLAKKYRNGTEILREITNYCMTMGDKFSNQILVNFSQDKTGERIILKVEVKS